ncbi:MAG: AbrB/MazE/SpoVT family DNA-binding domain-containing protein [Candidatus Altiarchaeota archaeon]
MDIESIKLGERGQVVIPQDFRTELKLRGGDKMLAVLVDNKIVLESMRNIKAESIEQVREDLADLKVCAKFWDDLKKGKDVIKQNREDFLRDLEKW